MKKIAILSSGHPSVDERLYWKFGHSLANEGNLVQIITSLDDLSENNGRLSVSSFKGNNLSKNEKKLIFLKKLKEFSPDIIISAEPFPILAAYSFKKKYNKNAKIIMDVTEWYPENEILKTQPFNLLKYLTRFFLLILVSNLSDHIIVGEITKKKRYSIIAPFIKKTIISYYPILKFFPKTIPLSFENELVLCYAGLLKFDRGLKQIIQVAQKTALSLENVNVKLKLIGKFESEMEEKEFESMLKDINSLKIEKIGWVKYPEISSELENVHFCFDLRKLNFVYKNSLPIKVFEYMAAGKPFFFTEVKPLYKEFGIPDFGYFVNPDSIDEISTTIVNLYNNPDKYIELSLNGRKRIENGRNWEAEYKKLSNLLFSKK